MVLTHVERGKDEKASQLDRMRARFAPGVYPGPKAGAGVYASSSSVATPGRLPDGREAENTIPAILPKRELSETEAAPKGTDGR
jgi:NADH-quinone oxidoreductase subunit J